MILSNWERRQIFGAGGCPLCGLNWVPRDATSTGIVEARILGCTDRAICSERWLRKFLSGKPLTIEAVTFLGQGPSQQAVFEVTYRPQDGAELKRRVLMPEVSPGGDVHRRSEHYHLIEFGVDITTTFTP
ncbi:MAG: hypothetical protein EXR48_04875 [Dehalococcoidia bacterium]|nr:hypothetical protein [Dehalococcoidia bacterium]